MAWEPKGLLESLNKAVDGFDPDETARLSGEIVAGLNAGEAIDANTARKILSTLRRKSYFGLMESVAEALHFTGQDDAQVRRQYAQALIDQGKLTGASYVLEGLADRTEGRDPEENAEARGLQGRLFKQLYINGAARDPLHQRYLQQAVAKYLGVYLSAPQKFLWQGVNALALTARAAKDEVPLEHAPDSGALAREILATVEALEKPTAWDFATAAEASLALGEEEDTLLWLSRYLKKKDDHGAWEADAFELASTRRQLKEVWGLTIEEPPGSLLLPLLEAALLKRSGGRVDLASSEVRPTLQKIEKTEERASASLQFEKILGKEGVVSLSWYKTGLDRTQSVAKVLNKLEEGFGTGFLVRGGDLVPAFGDEVLLLTNAHVMSDNAAVQGQYGSLDPADAQIIFENFEAAAQKKYRVAKLLFTSPPTELDATLLRLDPPPPPCATYPVGKRLPALDGTQKVYVIGHPRGGGLSISLNDNLLLDWDDQKIHYRAPTEGGSSGSPVFNQQWDLIGLHHAGSMNLPKLKGQEGTYPANEGIWIQRIIKALNPPPTP
jgi:hypothetical protein